ncbi:TylF/MycF/NovP-related O-methyltransferase [Pseudomonadota bacterium]
MLHDRYLDLVKSTLVNELYIELEAQLLMSVLCAAQNLVLDLPEFWAVRKDRGLLSQLLAAKQDGETILLDTHGDSSRPGVDHNLRNYSEFAYTLVGRKRLDNLQQCIEDILDNDVPGDLLEAGVWRGGCCIMMSAVLAAHGCLDRNVWLADSFAGLPRSKQAQDQAYPMDASLLPVLAVPVEEVQQNFERFGLLNGQVKFLPGWFHESLPGSETGPLALLRIDCDLYDSTLTVLDALYSRVSTGGWVIIDDYGILPPCQRAVDEFRERHAIQAPMKPIDAHAVCWKVA